MLSQNNNFRIDSSGNNISLSVKTAEGYHCFFSNEWSRELEKYIQLKLNSEKKEFLLHMFKWEIDKLYSQDSEDFPNSDHLTERYRKANDLSKDVV